MTGCQRMAKEWPWDRDPGTVTPGLGWALHLSRRVGGFGVERETGPHIRTLSKCRGVVLKVPTDGLG